MVCEVSCYPTWEYFCDISGHPSYVKRDGWFKTLRTLWQYSITGNSTIFQIFIEADWKSTSRLYITSPLRGESTGHRWIPLTKGQWCGRSWRHNIYTATLPWFTPDVRRNLPTEWTRDHKASRRARGYQCIGLVTVSDDWIDIPQEIRHQPNPVGLGHLVWYSTERCPQPVSNSRDGTKPLYESVLNYL